MKQRIPTAFAILVLLFGPMSIFGVSCAIRGEPEAREEAAPPHERVQRWDWQERTTGWEQLVRKA